MNIGTAAKMTPHCSGDVTAVMSGTGHPVNGDKFTALHGQKGVITTLNDIDVPTVRRKHAEIITGIGAMTKRETPSQLLEATFTQFHLDESVGMPEPKAMEELVSSCHSCQGSIQIMRINHADNTEDKVIWCSRVKDWMRQSCIAQAHS